MVTYFRSFLSPATWASLYTIWHTEIEINDEISILGILKIDPDSNVFFMEKPIAILKNDVGNGLESLKLALMCDQLNSAVKVFFYMGMITGATVLI